MRLKTGSDIRPNVRLAAVALVALLIGGAGAIEQGWVLGQFTLLFEGNSDPSTLEVGKRIGMATLGIVSIGQLLVLIFGAKWALAKDESTPKSVWKYLALAAASVYPVAFSTWLAIEGTSSFVVGEQVFTWTSAHLLIAPYLWLTVAIPARIELSRGLDRPHLLALLGAWALGFVVLSLMVTESIWESLVPLAAVLIALAVTSLKEREKRTRGFMVAVWTLPVLGAIFSVVVVVGLAMWPWVQSSG